MTDTIYLEPDLFMALGLSAEAFGGIGVGSNLNRIARPSCIEDHAWSVTSAIPEAGECAYSLLVAAAPNVWWGVRNDTRLRVAGIKSRTERVPFQRWCEIVGVDVKA
jgi:hypothetical protein